MKLKKIICFSLAAILCFSLVGCGEKEVVKEEPISSVEEAAKEVGSIVEGVKEATEGIKEIVEEVEEKVEEIENVQEEGFVFEPLEYKMAKIGSSKVDDKYVYAFVVEVPVIESEDITYTVDVFDKEGNQYYDITDFSVNCYESNIVTEEYLEEVREKFEKQEKKAKENNDEEAMKFGPEFPWFLMNYQSDEIYTYVLTSEKEITEDDFKIVFKRNYFDYVNNVDDETVLEFNAEIDEINVNPYYTSGNSLLKINDTYVLYNKSVSGVGSMFLGDGKNADFESLYFIDVLNPFKNEKDLSIFEGVEFNWYYGLDKVEVPEEYESFFNLETSDANIGFQIGLSSTEENMEELEKFVDRCNPAIVTSNGDIILS